MELKNIFKMEIFKNRNDATYLKIIAILTVAAAVASILGILMMKNEISEWSTIVILLPVFTVIALAIFSLLYPFHLLNVDYKNKVMSLIFASGVSREKYYFVKISATILSCLIATFMILFIPSVTFLIVYPDEFVKFIRNIITSFNSSDIFSFVLSAIIGLIANIVMLTTAVIITKGKTSGIFLYLAFVFIVSIIQTSFKIPLLLTGVSHISNNFYIDTVISIVKILVFALIGLHVLRKQDL